jgi:hypothetical protein
MTERFHLELTEDNRIGRHWDVRGVTGGVYAELGQTVVSAGVGMLAYTDPAQVRELADFLTAAADRMEGQ